MPPTFKEVRHILNLATINAIADHLKLVTFDADDTIYEDGGIINSSSRMVKIIVELLKRGIVVSLVTAAGYPGKPERYEERLRGILDALEELSPEERARFLVMGGECNYLLETYVNAESGKISLRELPGHVWKDGRGERWKEEDVQKLLDVAERVLREMTTVLHLPAEILRKDRAIGIINTSHKRFLYENLEETCLTVQHELKEFAVPFCAFNGGNDVWVDIGNKALGIQALQKYVLRFLPKDLQGEEFVRELCIFAYGLSFIELMTKPTNTWCGRWLTVYFTADKDSGTRVLARRRPLHQDWQRHSIERCGNDSVDLKPERDGAHHEEAAQSCRRSTSGETCRCRPSFERAARCHGRRSD